MNAWLPPCPPPAPHPSHSNPRAWPGVLVFSRSTHKIAAAAKDHRNRSRRPLQTGKFFRPSRNPTHIHHHQSGIISTRSSATQPGTIMQSSTAALIALACAATLGTVYGEYRQARSLVLDLLIFPPPPPSCVFSLFLPSELFVVSTQTK